MNGPLSDVQRHQMPETSVRVCVCGGAHYEAMFEHITLELV